MPLVDFGHLQPTNELVRYDDSNYLVYPERDMADTFGTIWAGKVYGNQFDTLELGTSGRIAYTVSNEHSLDFDLNIPSNLMAIRARNNRNLFLQNDSGNAYANFKDDDTLAVSSTVSSVFRSDDAASLRGCADSNRVTADGSGVTVDAGCGDNKFYVQSDASHCFFVGGDEVTCLSSNGVGMNVLDVSESLTVPVGATADRPAPPQPGMVFYNTEHNTFEGYSLDWNSLGGVIDLNRDTYIQAEEDAGVNDDNLRFVTDGSERMRIDKSGFIGMGTSNPEYRLDVSGDVRFSSNLFVDTWYSSNSGGHSDQIQPKCVVLGVEYNAGEWNSNQTVDGAFNDKSGILVAGVPQGIDTASAHKKRFEKSVKWNRGSGGMLSLGTKAGFSEESHWELKGGAFHMTHTNGSTGGEVGFIFRVNAYDQLELVRKSQSPDNLAVKYEHIAYFGDAKRSGGKATGISSGVGYASIDVFSSHLQNLAAPYTADVNFTSFETSAEYTLHAAVFPVSVAPSVQDVLDAVAAGHGYTASNLAPGSDVSTSHSFAAYHDGTVFDPAALPIVAMVVEQPSTNMVSSAPYIDYIINNAARTQQLSDEAALLGLETNSTEGVTSFSFKFEQYSWTSLSPAAQSAFIEWFELQLYESMVSQGFNVSDVTLAVSEGSIAVLANVTLSIDEVALLANTINTDPLSVVSRGGNRTIELDGGVSLDLQDTANFRLDTTNGVLTTTAAPARLTLAVETTQHYDSLGALDGIMLTATTDNDSAVAAVYVVTTTEPLHGYTPEHGSSTVKRAGTAYTIASLAAAVIPADPEGATYVYVCVEDVLGNLSAARKVDNPKLEMFYPDSIGTDALGRPNLITQNDGEGNYAVTLKDDILVASEARGGTAYMLLYGEGQTVPATGVEALADVHAGETSFVQAEITQTPR